MTVSHNEYKQTNKQNKNEKEDVIRDSGTCFISRDLIVKWRDSDMAWQWRIFKIAVNN